MKKFNLFVLSCLTGSSLGMASSINIYNDVYNLRGVSNKQEGMFYLQKMQTYTPWAWGASFKQSYANGTLVFGNSTKESGDGEVWFGRAGDIGYITSDFFAKEIYLTGTLGSGNGTKTGGGASFVLTSATDVFLQDWNLKLLKAGLQESSFLITARDKLNAQNIGVVDETAGSVIFRAGTFDFQATHMMSNGKIVFEKTSKDGGQIRIDSLTFVGGMLDLRNAQDTAIRIANIQASGVNIQTQELAGVVSWNGFTNQEDRKIEGGYEWDKRSLTLYGLIQPADHLELKAQEVNAKQARVVLEGKTLSALGDVLMGDLRINREGRANFENLKLVGSLSLQNGNLAINRDFEVRGDVKIFLNETLQSPIQVNGKTRIFVENRGRKSPIVSIYNISQLKGVKIGEEYVLLKSEGGIISPDLGTRNMLDYIGFYEAEGGFRFDNTISFEYKGLTVTKMLSQNSLGFRVEISNHPANPYDTNQIEYWAYHRGGEKLIGQINAIDRAMMGVFQDLMIVRNGAIWANDVVMGQDRNYLARVGRTIKDTANQVKSLQRKTNNLELLKFSTDTQTSDRLARLSLRKDSRLDQAKVSRGRIDAWGSAVVGAMGLGANQGMLYGANVGYDKVFKHCVLGGFVAYGYGMYQTGQLIEGTSHNAGVGLYSRFFVGGNEFDLGVSGMMGWNQENIVGNEVITQQFSQSYHYNAKSASVNLDYGYAFSLWQDKIALKPLVSLGYAYLTSSRIDGQSQLIAQDLLVYAGEGSGHILTANLGFETRVTAGKSSFVWLLLKASQDVYSSVSKNSNMRFAGTNAFDVDGVDYKNLSFGLSVGGEVKFFGRAFVNFSLGSELGVLYKEGKLAGNIGVGYSF